MPPTGGRNCAHPPKKRHRIVRKESSDLIFQEYTDFAIFWFQTPKNNSTVSYTSYRREISMNGGHELVEQVYAAKTDPDAADSLIRSTL